MTIIIQPWLVEVKYNCTVELPEVVRQVRSRLNKSQAEFGLLLACSQISISRYEAGTSPPRLGVLLRLRDIALPEERLILDAYIKKTLSAQGKWSSPNASVDSLRGLIEDSAIEEVFLQAVPDHLRDRWEPLVEIIARLQGTDSTVDETLIEIIRLWEVHRRHPRMPALLRDALGYLRLQLTLKA
jgi:transcriptional regulator with XRE-family HTH domain